MFGDLFGCFRRVLAGFPRRLAAVCVPGVGFRGAREKEFLKTIHTISFDNFKPGL